MTAGDGHDHPHTLRGILLVLSAVFMFSSMDTIAKYLLRTYPLPPLIWARYVVQMVFMLVLLAPRMGWGLVRTSHPWLQILRGVLLVISSVFLLPVAHLPADGGSGGDHVRGTCADHRLVRSDAWGTHHPAPVGCGRPRLRRRADHHPPGRRLLTPTAIFPLCSALAFSFYQIITRKIVGREHALTTLFYTALVGTAVTSLGLRSPGTPRLWDRCR